VNAPIDELAEPERGLQPLLRAVDDAAVIAEHEAADRRHGDNCGNEAVIDAVPTSCICHVVFPLLNGAARRFVVNTC
jgi:hypothetical protein